MTANSDHEIRHIHDRWHASILNRDLDGLMALYAEDATLETPLVLVTLPEQTAGILRGKREIRLFFEAGLRKLANDLGRWYRTDAFFTDGRQLIWEYPRATPNGEQVDLVEVMDLENGLIAHHRVYWGWVGVKALLAASNAPAA